MQLGLARGDLVGKRPARQHTRRVPRRLTVISPTDLEERCPRCALPRNRWTDNGRGYPKLELLYCCRGCAEEAACICLEAGPSA